MAYVVVHQRSSEVVGRFGTYIEAAEHRADLRWSLPPDRQCEWAIRSEVGQ